MTTTQKPKTVWTGAKALRRFLVPVGDIEVFPGNPRRGNVEAIRASLRRFGQTKPVLGAVFPGGSGNRIAAGHHFVQAAQLEGFTHVAVIPNEFASEEEARAYLLADNRTSDLGYYDLDALHEQLVKVKETVGLDGTGYDPGYLEEIQAQMDALRRDLLDPEPPDAFPPLDPNDLAVEHRCPSCGYEWSGDPAPSFGGDDPEQ